MRKSSTFSLKKAKKCYFLRKTVILDSYGDLCDGGLLWYIYAKEGIGSPIEGI